jgi:hypothetical protein
MTAIGCASLDGWLRVGAHLIDLISRLNGNQVSCRKEKRGVLRERAHAVPSRPRVFSFDSPFFSDRNLMSQSCNLNSFFN